MAEPRQALERLCRRYGIDTDYTDIWGDRHAVADPNLIALLAAFEVDASSDAACAAAVREADAAEWRDTLPPVAAVGVDDAGWTLPLRLPRSADAVKWLLREESGREHHGHFDTTNIEPTAQADLDGVAHAEWRVEPGIALPAGYHALSIEGREQPTLLIAAPPRCYRPPALTDGGRVWGPAAQLYALRSERNWGIGDFGDLARFAEQAAERGAGIVGVNPMHAMFPHNPGHVSPYSPSSRSQLNVLYIDVEAVADFRDCEAAQKRVRSADFQARLAQLREQPLVDYRGVAAAKFEILEMLYANFRDRHLAAGGSAGAKRLAPGSDSGDEHPTRGSDAGDRHPAQGSGAAGDYAATFRRFQTEGGVGLRLHTTWEALQAKFHAEDASVWGWQVWPEAFRDAAGEAVTRFADANAERIEYYQYLQWQADRQLAAVSRHCRERGLAVGLYLDLAVSVDRAGSDAWAHHKRYALGASVGAPPDEFNPNGQNWGLPPMRPDRLREHGYRFFIDTLVKNMKSAGAIRIDHVMGLMRLYWIAPGGAAGDGAYVHYRLDEMMAIVALESERNRCMVIGEDLGTVAEAMSHAIAQYELLSYRLLYFERERGGIFKPAADYPREALVAVSTHDLATLAGWWTGHDLETRHQLKLYPDDSVYEKQLIDRAEERVRLLLALRHAGLLPDGVELASGGVPELTPALVEAIHAFVAEAPSRVMMVQLEDAIGVVDQANMPGTTDEHPNWRQKLPETLEQLSVNPRALSLAARLAKIRPHPALRRVDTPAAEVRVPRATYRLQFNKTFTFDDAIAVLPYLKRLGVSHVYCSPILKARPGSMHGYDIVAHDEINPELGGADGYERFSAALHGLGMGQMLDMVPNHMGVLGADNAWWMDVLENGAASRYAHYFDIDWHPVNADLEGKVLVPALGEHYGTVLANNELAVHFEADSGTFALRYYDHRFPLNPRSYATVLKRAAELTADVAARAEVSSLAAAFGHLPRRDSPSAEAIAERARDKEFAKSRLAELAGREPGVVQAIGAALAELNAADGHDALHELLEAQAFRLAYWRVASDEINYRRFFDINELAALRMECEDVFEATHGFALELAARGVVDGLRIDHPDGLYDPAQYFRRLQEGYARRAGIALPERDAKGRPSRPLYVLAEKIVAPHESVPDTWALHGTTGYRFAMVVNGVLVDTTAKAKFDRIWRAFTGQDESFEELAYQGKRAIMKSGLASELTVLSSELLRIARADRRTRDFTFNTLRQALAEIAACMPVYRTYIIDKPSKQDVHYIDWAVAQARRKSRAADVSIFDFVRRVLLAEAIDGTGDELQERIRRFAVRFQQFTSPVAAKGVEDTAFYRYSPLISLNEVGGDPAQFGMSVKAFHRAGVHRAEHWPYTMLATSTHDHKRSADVRARIDVLSEMPAAWRLALRRWSRLNRAHRRPLGDDLTAPSPADEYLLYQTLLGTLPPEGLDEASIGPYRDRMQAYMLKAVREAKVRTGWVSPDEEYEAALAGFIDGLLGRVQSNLFLDDLSSQVARLAWFGALNTASATLLKFASPGVPDIYQGHEVLNLTLVDPDNRRPIDYQALARGLQAFESMGPSDIATLAAKPEDGWVKLWITWRLLGLRREQPGLFDFGGYKPAAASGAKADHVVAFTRHHDGTTMVAIAGRLFAKLLDEPQRLPLGEAVWQDTSVAVKLPDGSSLTNILSGETVTVAGGRVRLSDAFGHFPGAVLVDRV